MRSKEQKLKVLRKLAAEGFRELDQGRGRTLTSEAGLKNAIVNIGHRAAKTRPSDRAK